MKLKLTKMNPLLCLERVQLTPLMEILKIDIDSNKSAIFNLFLYFCCSGLISWSPSCSLRVFPMDPSLSTWCLTLCWHMTLATRGQTQTLVALIGPNTMSSTASSSLPKRALTGRHCSWNFIIGITGEFSSSWKIYKHVEAKILHTVE